VRKAEESPLLEVIAMEWLAKALQVGEELACSDL
jgi:hypothetical protein